MLTSPAPVGVEGRLMEVDLETFWGRRGITDLVLRMIVESCTVPAMQLRLEPVYDSCFLKCNATLNRVLLRNGGKCWSNASKMCAQVRI